MRNERTKQKENALGTLSLPLLSALTWRVSQVSWGPGGLSGVSCLEDIARRQICKTSNSQGLTISFLRSIYTL